MPPLLPESVGTVAKATRLAPESRPALPPPPALATKLTRPPALRASPAKVSVEVVPGAGAALGQVGGAADDARQRQGDARVDADGRPRVEDDVALHDGGVGGGDEGAGQVGAGEAGAVEDQRFGVEDAVRRDGLEGRPGV